MASVAKPKAAKKATLVLERESSRKVRIEYEEIGKLKKFPGNPKLHDLEALAESVDAQGWVDPIVIDERTKMMAAGHGRLEELERRQKAKQAPPEGISVRGGKWFVPVLRGVRFKDEDALRKYVIGSNRIVELGGWDNTELTRLLSSLEGDFLGTGFEEGDLVRFLSLSQKGLTPEERADVFDNATTKQIVLYFDGKEYEQIINRMMKVMEAEGVDSNTAVLVKLLDVWEKNARTARPKAAARR